METYHKIQTLFKRHQSGSKKGKMIRGQWSTPELEYLADKEWEFTEKVDGTNIRINMRLSLEALFIDHGGRTDKAVIPEPLLQHLEKVFPTFPSYRRDIHAPGYHKRHAKLTAWMTDNSLEKVTLYGEGFGPKIQGGGKYREDHSFVLFDVKIGDFWLDRANVDDIASKLGIESVPVLGTGTLQNAIDIVESGWYFDSDNRVHRFGSGMLKSQWGDFEAEGIVARPVVPLFNRKGERIITKIKAVDFKSGG